jgi:hypothetical protein
MVRVYAARHIKNPAREDLPATSPTPLVLAFRSTPFGFRFQPVSVSVSCPMAEATSRPSRGGQGERAGRAGLARLPRHLLVEPSNEVRPGVICKKPGAPVMFNRLGRSPCGRVLVALPKFVKSLVEPLWLGTGTRSIVIAHHG